jgi:hypothetical protein
VIKVDVRTGSISSDDNFELLLYGLELAAADAAATDVMPRRTQRILNASLNKNKTAHKPSA